VAESADASDLSANLSARRETGGAKLLKFGEPCNMAIPSQARPESGREGVETRRAAPNIPDRPGHGEGIVQTPNPAARKQGRRKPWTGTKIRWAARPVRVQVPPPAPTFLLEISNRFYLQRDDT